MRHGRGRTVGRRFNRKQRSGRPLTTSIVPRPRSAALGMLTTRVLRSCDGAVVPAAGVRACWCRVRGVPAAVVAASQRERGGEQAHCGSYRRWLPPAKRRSLRLKGDSPVRQYLLSSLRVQDPVVDTLVGLYPALAELTTADLETLIDPNLNLLKGLAPADHVVTQLVCTKPKLLALPLASWYQFLSSYGLSDQQVWRLFNNQPALMLQGSIYAAGKAIMFLKSLGWSDLEVNAVVIPSYPHILRMSCVDELQPILEYVQQLGLPPDLQAELLGSYPSIFCSSYRAVIAEVLAGSERYWSKRQHRRQQPQPSSSQPRGGGGALAQAAPAVARA